MAKQKKEEIQTEELAVETDEVKELEVAESEPEAKERKQTRLKSVDSQTKSKLTPKKYQHGKKYRNVVTEIEKGKEYSIEEAVALLKKTSVTKFDATVEIHVNLNIDPSNADHQIRGSVSMPSGLGRAKRICAIVNPDKEKEAKDAGAETVGGQDVVAKIEKGWLDFDVVVATPDMMAFVGKLGKILGTKGLMPNPKTGTVTNDPAKAIMDIKKGKADYKIDKQGNLHSAIGKVSFTDKALLENINAYMEAIHHSKPQSLKGTFIKSVYLATSMGPSVKIVK